MCYIDFDDCGVSTWRKEWRKARKPHKCDTCSSPIAPGERYISAFYVQDGEAYGEEQCASCGEIGERFAKEHGNSWPFPSSLFECVDGCVSDRDPDSARWAVDRDAIKARNEAARSARA